MTYVNAASLSVVHGTDSVDVAIRRLATAVQAAIKITSAARAATADAREREHKAASRMRDLQEGYGKAVMALDALGDRLDVPAIVERLGGPFDGSEATDAVVLDMEPVTLPVSGRAQRGLRLEDVLRAALDCGLLVRTTDAIGSVRVVLDDEKLEALRRGLTGTAYREKRLEVCVG